MGKVLVGEFIAEFHTATVVQKYKYFFIYPQKYKPTALVYSLEVQTVFKYIFFCVHKSILFLFL